MQKLTLIFIFVGLVAVFAEEDPTTGAPAAPETDEETAGNVVDDAIKASSESDDAEERNATETRPNHRRRQPLLSKETVQKLREIFDKEQTKEERQKAVEELGKTLNEKEQKALKFLAKKFEKAKELEDKLSADAKAALQKVKDLKKQVFAVFKDLNEEDRKALGSVLRASKPHHGHHHGHGKGHGGKGKGFGKFKHGKFSRRGSKAPGETTTVAA